MLQVPSSPPVSIRPARAEDASALTAICVASKRSNGYDDAFMAACADELAVTPKRIADERIVVAATDRPIGCASLIVAPDGRSAEVASYFVEPHWIGHGVGRRLWAVLLESANELGLERLFLDADPAAEGFYAGLGFETVGRVPSGSIPGRTLPHMELTLETAGRSR